MKKIIIPIFTLLLFFGCISFTHNQQHQGSYLKAKSGIEPIIKKVFGSYIVYSVSESNGKEIISYKLPRTVNGDDYQKLLNEINQTYNATSTAATQKSFMIKAKNVTVIGIFGKDIISVLV